MVSEGLFEFCAAPGCTKLQQVRELCRTHYYQAWKASRSEPCNVDGCSDTAKARGMCMKHYKRHRKLGAADAKRCPRCGLVKPSSEFSPDSSKRDGLASKCKQCGAEVAKQRYYRQLERERARHRESKHDEYRRMRAVAIEVYGGKCVQCGATDDLEFDHVNNDGHEHRKHEDNRTMLRRIYNSGKPISDYELQLLCKPCHRRKSRAVHAAAIAIGYTALRKGDFSGAA